MKPAFSVIFLTTLIGAGQALLFLGIILYWAQLAEPSSFMVTLTAVSLALLVAGLVASFFHLGHPERAWRAASQWRTSWLSREVIVLPLLMVCVFVLHLHLVGLITLTDIVVHSLAVSIVFLVILLYVCTAMIYMCLRFIQEWASRLTLMNFVLHGFASATLVLPLVYAYAGIDAPLIIYIMAILFIVLAAIGRLTSSYRNKKIAPTSSLQSATGINAKDLRQQTRGFTVGAYNLQAFFHGASLKALSNIKIIMWSCAYAIPLVVVIFCLFTPNLFLSVAALAIHYIGLVAERWLFFAQASHPQNLYYQQVS